MSTKKKYELKKILEELCNGEKIIIEKLHSNKTSYKNGYEKYGVFDKSWVQRYKGYIIDYLNGKSNQEFNYDINELKPKLDEKIFCIIKGDNYNKYSFPKQYVLVTSNFISMIAKYFNHKENKIYDRLYDIFIGGKCIIRKDKRNDLEHYITLLYDENDDNYVDFILSFEIKENMEEHLDFILKNDFFYYVELIKYSNEPEKIIKDFENDIILGYIYRNCDEKRGKFLLEMKDDKTNYPHEIKQNDKTNRNNADKINININPNINENNNNNMNNVNNVIINNKNMNYMNNFNNNNNNMIILNNITNMNFMNNRQNMNYGNNMNIAIHNRNNMNNNNMNYNNNFNMNNNNNNINNNIKYLLLLTWKKYNLIYVS